MRASRFLIALFLGFASTCFAQGPTWTQKCLANGPQGGYYPAMVYDSAHSQTVLFGGVLDPNHPIYLNDTWTWDGFTWTKQSPASSPPARVGFGMAYDAARRQVVIFGGGTTGRLSDTWVWDGVNWTQKALGPGALVHMGMVYDAARQQVVMFGGALALPPRLVTPGFGTAQVGHRNFHQLPQG